MKGFVFILLLYLFLGVEGPLMKHLDIAFLIPEITMAFLVYISIHFDFIPGITTIFFMGLLKDGFSYSRIVGINSEVLILLFLLLRIVKEKYSVTSVLPLTLLSLICIVLNNILYMVFSIIFDPDVTSYFLIIKILPVQIIISVPFLLLIIMMLRRIDMRFFKDRSRIFLK